METIPLSGTFANVLEPACFRRREGVCHRPPRAGQQGSDRLLVGVGVIAGKGSGGNWKCPPKETNEDGQRAYPSGA